RGIDPATGTTSHPHPLHHFAEPRRFPPHRSPAAAWRPLRSPPRAEAMPRPAVLVIEPAAAVAEAVRQAVGARAEVRAVATLGDGLEQLRGGEWAALVLSLDLPAADLALVRRITEAGTPAGSMVLLASRPTMQMMVEASRLGVL